eukprot:362473_1
MNIETLKGRPLAKKCMNLFGRTLCIREFMDWLNGKIIGGNTKHICYSPVHKASTITQQSLKLNHEAFAKDKKVDVQKVRLGAMAREKDIAMKKHDHNLIMRDKEGHGITVNQLA